jgi:hypothetical protein
MTMSNRSLIMLADALRQRRRELGTTWRRPDAGRQALLVLAHLRKGETYPRPRDRLHRGHHDRLSLPPRRARRTRRDGPDPGPGDYHRRGKAFVTLDGTLLRIDRVGMASGQDRPFYSGKHKCHTVKVQVLADPAGRLIWTSPTLPGSRHDIAAAREHGLLDALAAADVHAVVDTGYQGAGPTVRVPQRRRGLDPDTGSYRRLSHNQKAVNTAHARQRGPDERVNAQLKSWKILRKIRCSPSRITTLVQAVQALILAS